MKRPSKKYIAIAVTAVLASVFLVAAHRDARSAGTVAQVNVHTDDPPRACKEGKLSKAAAKPLPGLDYDWIEPKFSHGLVQTVKLVGVTRKSLDALTKSKSTDKRVLGDIVLDGSIETLKGQSLGSVDVTMASSMGSGRVDVLFAWTTEDLLPPTFCVNLALSWEEAETVGFDTEPFTNSKPIAFEPFAVELGSATSNLNIQGPNK